MYERLHDFQAGMSDCAMAVAMLLSNRRTRSERMDPADYDNFRGCRVHTFI